MARHSPTADRRRLSVALRTLRVLSKLNGVEASSRSGVDPSKLTRIEKGTVVAPTSADVDALLDVYAEVVDLSAVVRAGESDPRAYLLGLTMSAAQRSWWNAFTSLPKELIEYIGLESAATMLQDYETVLIPGLFQTREYTEAMLRGHGGAVPESLASQVLAVRHERQTHALSGPDPLWIRAVFGEAALRQQLGGRDVMRAQLEHLLKLAARDHVHLQVLPFAREAIPIHGPFTILMFDDPLLPEVVSVEGPGGMRLIEDQKRVAGLGVTFVELIGAALSGTDTIIFIEDILAEMNAT